MHATISLQESEIANIQAIEALKGAKRMEIFTIASVVFVSIGLLSTMIPMWLIVNIFSKVPLSFITSLFALDVSSFLQAPTWSLVVICKTARL